MNTESLISDIEQNKVLSLPKLKHLAASYTLQKDKICGLQNKLDLLALAMKANASPKTLAEMAVKL